MKKTILAISLVTLLLFSFVSVDIAYAEDSLPIFYNANLKKSYYQPLSDEQIEELVDEYSSGHNIAKLIGNKLVDYNELRAKVINIFVEGIGNNLETNDIIANIAKSMPTIISELDEVIIETPGEEDPEGLKVIDIY